MMYINLNIIKKWEISNSLSRADLHRMGCLLIKNKRLNQSIF